MGLNFEGPKGDKVEYKSKNTFWLIVLWSQLLIKFFLQGDQGLPGPPGPPGPGQGEQIRPPPTEIQRGDKVPSSF